MNKQLEEVIKSLNLLSEKIINAANNNNIDIEKTFVEVYGWNSPALSTQDLSNLASNIVKQLSQLGIVEISKEIEDSIKFIPSRINLFINNTLSQLYTGNAVQVIAAYISLINWINCILEPLFSWEILESNNALPLSLSNKMKNLLTELDQIKGDKSNLDNQIRLINNTKKLLDNLPSYINDINERKKYMHTVANSAKAILESVESDKDDIKRLIAENTALISSLNDDIIDKNKRVDILIDKCNDAYNIVTTKGLAGAFDVRANSLSRSMWLWVIGLLIALGISVYIGSLRFDALNESFKNNIAPAYIWIQIFLSVLSLGAPIWFAWIATKQISQRFKLSEDYAFKASVAKSYEGYKSEAMKIDKELEKRVLGSVLSRLEEAPLRLMETTHHGSPFHELLNSNKSKESIQSSKENNKKIPEMDSVNP